MDSSQNLSSRHADFRRSGQLLSRLAMVAQFGCVLLGLYLFLDQSKDLISDAQFTWGERRVMGIIAVITLGGSVLIGWILAQMFRLSAGVLEILADGAESAARTNELIEQRLLPELGRIASILEEFVPPGPSEPRATPATATSPAALQSELKAAQAAGRVNKAIDLRDALTRHLRGEALQALDSALAVWLLNLVERRVQAGTVDQEVAGWVTRALDSLGSMPETEPLRQALPSLRRHAGLCVRCGRVVAASGANPEGICADCRRQLAGSSDVKTSGSRPVPSREKS